MATKIKHVYGNVLRVAIPLSQQVRTLQGGKTVVKEENFYPSPDYPVEIVLYKGGGLKKTYEAEMDGNVATFVDNGEIPIGVYQVEVLCHDANNEPCRYMARGAIEIVDATIDAGIEAGIEFNSTSYTLDGSVFFFAKGGSGGDDGGDSKKKKKKNRGVSDDRVVVHRAIPWSISGGSIGKRYFFADGAVKVRITLKAFVEVFGEDGEFELPDGWFVLGEMRENSPKVLTSEIVTHFDAVAGRQRDGITIYYAKDGLTQAHPICIKVKDVKHLVRNTEYKEVLNILDLNEFTKSIKDEERKPYTVEFFSSLTYSPNFIVLFGRVICVREVSPAWYANTKSLQSAIDEHKIEARLKHHTFCSYKRAAKISHGIEIEELIDKGYLGGYDYTNEEIDLAYKKYYSKFRNRWRRKKRLQTDIKKINGIFRLRAKKRGYKSVRYVDVRRFSFVGRDGHSVDKIFRL